MTLSVSVACGARSVVVASLALASAAVCCTVPRCAIAQQARPALELHWQAPVGCPAGTAIEAAIARTLGPAPDGDGPDRLVVRVRLVRDRGDGWRLRLATTHAGSTHSQDLHSHSCPALGDAAALVLAFLIDPTAAGEAVARSNAPAEAGPGEASVGATTAPSGPPTDAVPAPQPVPAVPVPVTEPPSPRPGPTAAPRPGPTAVPRARVRRPGARLGGLVRLTAGGDLGSLPSLAAGPGGALGLRYGLLGIEATAVVDVPQSPRRTDLPTVGADLTLFVATLDGCMAPTWGRWGLDVCVGGELGSLAGQGVGVDHPLAGSSLRVAIEAHTAARVRLTPWLGLYLGLGASVPLFRPQFTLGGFGTIFQAAALSGRGTLGVEVYFGS